MFTSCPLMTSSSDWFLFFCFSRTTAVLCTVCTCSVLTNKAKDVSDGWDEDDQQVIEDQDDHRDQQVPRPAELPTTEQQGGDGGADLREENRTVRVWV